VLNISNFTSINKPSWLLGAPPEPARPSGPGAPARTAARRPPPAGTGHRWLRALATAGWILLGWLTAQPRRLADRLFVMNDTEAYWRDWQITKTHGGLGRRYRDPSFDLPAEHREPRGLPGPGG
jgi:hypothetical protein